MANTLSKEKASPMEAEKLVEELQELIKVKGLDVTLTVPKKTGERLLRGCSQCTVCPCIMCW
jgi:hypothetical protein